MPATDLKHIFRRLLRSPMFAAMTLITLAIGIGANTAIFTVINAVLLKPLPYPEPDRLISVWFTAPGVGIKELEVSPASYFTFSEHARTFQSVGLWTRGSATVTGVAEPEQVDTLVVTHSLLPTIGVQPARGRWFTATDDAPKTPETVMLSYGYWQRRFGGSPSAIGSKLMVNGRSCDVIGVMPENFRFMSYQPALILPFRFNRAELHLGNFSFHGVARLKPGATLEQASTDVSRMIRLMFGMFPAPFGMSVRAFEETRLAPNLRLLKQDVVGDVGKVLWVLMATVGIVLLIACANVASLLLVRADGRQQEIAVRAALGASWTRLAREFLLESVALGLIGGVVGVALAHAAMRLLVALAPTGLPRLDEIAVDPAVLAFAFGISVVSGILFGLIPVFKYGRPRVGLALRAGGRTVSDSRQRHRTRNALVIVQVALALVLLIGSGLMIRTVQALRQVQPGFTDPHQILTVRISIPGAEVPEAERAGRMLLDIADRLSAITGVNAVSLSNSITMDGNHNRDPIYAEDRPYSDSKVPPIRTYKHIGPGYFRTMGNTIVTGRDITWQDIQDYRPVALVSENLARELWGAPNAAIGKRIRESPKGEWREIIGVAGNERDDGVDQKAPAIIYWPYWKRGFYSNNTDVRRTMTFAIRSPRAGSTSFLDDVRRAIWSVNSNLPLANVRSVQEIYERSIARTSFTLVMLSIAAAMALLLGVVGIYGVISYSISQRTREIGIRMALGAPLNRVQGMFVRHGLMLAAAGVVCGTAVAIPLTRLMAALLFGISPFDPLTYAAVAALLVVAALVATYLPARRATRVEPVIALRAE